MEAKSWRRKLKSEEERWQLPFSYELNTGNKPILISQREFNSVETIGLTVWDSSLVLCKYLEKLPSEFFQDKRCIDLGSGTGLLGIVIGHLGVKEVLLTDYDSEAVLSLLRENVHNNSLQSVAKVLPLEWGKHEYHKYGDPFDIIVAADCIYDEDCILPLIISLRELSDHNTTIFMSFDEHQNNTGPMHMFFETAKNVFTIEYIDKHEMDPVYQDDLIKIIKMKKKTHWSAEMMNSVIEGDLQSLKTHIEVQNRTPNFYFFERGPHNRRTPLQAAVLCGHKSIVEYLLAHGANALLKSKNSSDLQKNALQLAAQENNTEILHILQHVDQHNNKAQS